MHVQLHTIPELKSNDAPRHAVISLIQRCPEQPGQSVFVPRPVSYFACIFIIQCCGAKIICFGSFAHNFGSGYTALDTSIYVLLLQTVLYYSSTILVDEEISFGSGSSSQIMSIPPAPQHFLFFIMILQSWPNFCLVGIK